MAPSAVQSTQPHFNAEILTTILSFNLPRDAARCARVCKAWLDVALNHVWWDVKGFKVLFNILAPLVPGDEFGNGPLIFSRPITTDDWKRLGNFTRRVRTFKIGEEDGVGHDDAYLEDSVFNKVLATRSTTHFLPNLQCLTVDTNLYAVERVEAFLFVLSERLKCMNVYLQALSEVEHAVYFMKEAAHRAPNIREIAFSEAWDRPIFSPFAREIFSKYSHLEILGLSSCSVDATMLSALSHSSSLKHVKLIDWGRNGRKVDTKEIHTAQLAPKASQFRHLHRLTLQSRIPDIIALLPNLHCLGNLTFLRLDSISASFEDDISSLLQILSSSCKKMKLLSITRNEDFSKVPAGGGSITNAVLQHLSHFRSLETFNLFHVQPLEISNQELVDIIHSCRNLKTFGLHRDSSVCTTNGRSSLTLDLLRLLIDPEKATCLEELLLEVDTGIIPKVSLEPTNTQNTRIRKLSFGYSPLKRDDASKVAAYLDTVVSSSCTLSKDCKILMSKHKENSFIKAKLDGLNVRKESWRIVAESLELLCAARRRSSQEILLLQRTISNLRRELEGVSR